jgi:hypothetical protein
MKPKAIRKTNTQLWQNRTQTKIRGNKESLFIVIKGRIHWEAITIVHIYAPNVRWLNFIKQTQLNIIWQSRTQTKIRGNKEGLFIAIKGRIHWEVIAIVNLYTPNVRWLNFIKQTQLDIKTQIDPNTIILHDFNTTLSLIGHVDKKINKETQALNNTISQFLLFF